MQLQFHDISLSSKALVEKYLKPWQSENAEFGFAHIYMWGGDGKIQYAEADGFLFLKLHFPGETMFFWPPFPKDEAAKARYREGMQLACQYMEEVGMRPLFKSVAEPFTSWIQEQCPEMVLEERRENFDYVYEAESLITLKGKKLHGKRNHINKIRAEHPDFQYEELTAAHYEQCMALYDDWRLDHKEPTITQYDERSSVERALLNLDELGLTGGVIYIDGVLKAFTVGERILPWMHQIHIEKAAKDIDGLYPLINKQYAAAHCADVQFINREEDMGLEGLRKAKQSYRPARMVIKYDVLAPVEASAKEGKENCQSRQEEPETAVCRSSR